MRNLVALPLLGLAVMFQSSVMSHITLLSGFGDLPMVMLAAWAIQPQVDSGWHWAFLTSILVGFMTRVPWLVVALGYFAVVVAARILRRRVWQAPLVAMFLVTFAGTFVMHFLTYAALGVGGDLLPARDVVGLVTLPSLLLNLLFAIPVYALMRDLARWVYPGEENS
jgi:hypothetical protein